MTDSDVQGDLADGGLRAMLAAVVSLGAMLIAGCGGDGGDSATSTSSTSSSGGSSENIYAQAYKAVNWGTSVSVSFPSSCEMTLTTTGQPNYKPNAYYL